MDELGAIVAAIEQCDDESVLATVVDVDGSSYRTPGARMLILPFGAECDDEPRHIGMISGGCLERELCQSAFTLTHQGARLVSFDTRESRLHPHGRFGSGCSGLIHILLERLNGPTHPAVQLLRDVATAEKSIAAGVVCSGEGDMPKVGTRYNSASLRPSGSVERCVLESLAECRTSGRAVMTRFVCGDSWCEVFFQRVEPAAPLWIFGAGDDAIPLARMAEVLGLRVTVFDRRASLLTAARFGAKTVRRALHPTEIVARFELPAEASVVVMTHSLNDDQVLLPWLLQSDIGYVGLLGPKRRTGRLLKAMLDRGTTVPSERFDKLRTPAGLDLGATSAAQIALSILAEITAQRNSRDAKPLAERAAPIHDPARHDYVVTEPLVSLPATAGAAMSLRSP